MNRACVSPFYEVNRFNFMLGFVTKNIYQPPPVNYAYKTSMGNSKFNVSDAAVFSPSFY